MTEKREEMDAYITFTWWDYMQVRWGCMPGKWGSRQGMWASMPDCDVKELEWMRWRWEGVRIIDLNDMI